MPVAVKLERPPHGEPRECVGRSGAARSTGRQEAQPPEPPGEARSGVAGEFMSPRFRDILLFVFLGNNRYAI